MGRVSWSVSGEGCESFCRVDIGVMEQNYSGNEARRNLTELHEGIAQVGITWLEVIAQGWRTLPGATLAKGCPYTKLSLDVVG